MADFLPVNSNHDIQQIQQAIAGVLANVLWQLHTSTACHTATSWQHLAMNKKRVCVQLPTYSDNVAMLAFFSLQQSIHISCPTGPQQQQTCSRGFAAVGPRWDRQAGKRTDGWTPYRFINPAPHTMWPVPIISGLAKWGTDRL